MTVKTIIRMGHPTLRLKASPLSLEDISSNETKDLIQDLFETMSSYEGIGIAAPQIGISKQLAIIGVPDESPRYPDQESTQTFVVINPKITILDEDLQGFWEGCLSVPGLRGFVERSRKVQIDYLDTDGNSKSLVVEDFLATVFQHELDHLDGILYVDKIKDMTKLSYLEEFSEYWTEED